MEDKGKMNERCMDRDMNGTTIHVSKMSEEIYNFTER